MKPTKTFLTVAVFAAIQFTGAQQAYFSAPANSPQANVWVEKPQPKLITPFSENIPPQTGKITRYGRMSSQPWTQIVGWRPGVSLSAYENAEVPESQLHLFTINF